MLKKQVTPYRCYHWSDSNASCLLSSNPRTQSNPTTALALPFQKLNSVVPTFVFTFYIFTLHKKKSCQDLKFIITKEVKRDVSEWGWRADCSPHFAAQGDECDVDATFCNYSDALAGLSQWYDTSVFSFFLPISLLLYTWRGMSFLSFFTLIWK